MLAQEQVSFAPALAALTAALVVAGPVAVAVTKVVDFVRNLVGDRQTNVPKWVWNLLAFVVGIAVCVGWGINVLNALIQAVPALSDSSALDGTAGQLLTGVAVGAMASFWHEKLASWSAESHGIA